MSLTVEPVLTENEQLPAAVRRYVLAWNTHDVDAVLATLGAGGTYADPSTSGPLQGPALRAYLDGFFAAFPDVRFEIVSAVPDNARVTFEWLMRGTNTGPLRADLPPTGTAVALPGIDVVILDGDRIASVQGYFDQHALFAQLGLQVVVQPVALGPVSFGQALRLSTGSQAKPAAFSTTWIDVPSETERDEVIARTRAMFAELVQMPGFIGATFMNIAGRLSTQTAWESAEAAHALLRLPSHREALARVFRGELGAALQTSVWVPGWQNALWIRCATCGRVEAYERGAQSACGAPFPEQPSYW
jgi:steroid delta-isomerase-like uncharacterized protein